MSFVVGDAQYAQCQSSLLLISLLHRLGTQVAKIMSLGEVKTMHREHGEEYSR
jgi:hypothetical protein